MGVCMDENALVSAVCSLGWRAYSSKQPLEQLSLERAALAYRRGSLVKPWDAIALAGVQSQRSQGLVARQDLREGNFSI